MQVTHFQWSWTKWYWAFSVSASRLARQVGVDPIPPDPTLLKLELLRHYSLTALDVFEMIVTFFVLSQLTDEVQQNFDRHGNRVEPLRSALDRHRERFAHKLELSTQERCKRQEEAWAKIDRCYTPVQPEGRIKRHVLWSSLCAVANSPIEQIAPFSNTHQSPFSFQGISVEYSHQARLFLGSRGGDWSDMNFGIIETEENLLVLYRYPESGSEKKQKKIRYFVIKRYGSFVLKIFIFAKYPIQRAMEETVK